MARSMPIPDVGHGWMTDTIRELLGAIRGQHVAKKRATIIRLAFARANQQPMRDVFGQEDTCAENIWYMKWRFDPAITAAYEACCARALEWRDEETTRIQAYYRQERLRAIAEHAAQAPAALAKVMNDPEVGGAHRISAADRLMQLADPDLAQRVGAPTVAGQGGDQVVNVFAGWSDAELDQLLANLEAAEDSGAAGEETSEGEG